jgi:hypothetical protein
MSESLLIKKDNKDGKKDVSRSYGGRNIASIRD